MNIAISFLLTLCVAWFLYRPHLAVETEGAASDERGMDLQSLLEQKERAMQVLKDLELDFSMKKLSESDYQQMKRSLYHDLSVLLERIDRAR